MKIKPIHLLIMRGTFIYAFIIMAFMGSAFAKDVNAQGIMDRKISLNIINNNFSEVLNHLEKLADVKFIYSSAIIESERKVTYTSKNIPLSVLLEQMLQPLRLTFEVSGKLIVIKRKLPDIASTTEEINSAFLEQRTVTGQVTDEQNQPLPGVSIVEKGTTNSVATNEKGNFKITVADDKSVLIIRYVGYKTQEVSVSGHFVVNVQLAAEESSLNEVVVVGYGTQRKKDVTGAISSVNAKDIKNIAATNAVQAIQGKVSGVVITQNSWNPGAEATVRVRGTRSFNASNDPLYVIDGIPIVRGLNEINPTDIESMEVLKDASATAIYGSRGANGVIIITTKRGKSGKTSINVDSYAGIQKPLRSLDIMDGAEYADFVREAYRNRSSNPYQGVVPSQEEDKKVNIFAQSPYILQSVLAGYAADGTYNPANVRSFNWMDAVMGDGAIQNHQISVNGGSEKTKISLSGGYFSNKGLLKGSDYNRYSIRVNVDHQISNRFKIGGSNMISSILENTGSGSALYDRARNQNPLASPYNEDGSLLLNPGNDALAVNPLLDINGGVIEEHRRNRIISSLYLEANILDGLKFRSNFGYDYRTARDGIFQAKLSTPRNGSSSAAQYGGNRATGFTLENLLYYDKTFDKHTIGVTLLQSIQTDRFETSNASVDNIPYNSQQFYNVGSASNILGVASGFTQYKILSFMGRFNYSYLGKYLLTASIRSDGSSVLAPGNKYAYFPSAALAWRISEEKFLKGLSFIDNLKLRLGYGRTGNSSINPYQTLGSLNITRYPFDESVVLGFSPGSIPNAQLHWESTAQFNLGLEFGLFNSRISGALELYDQKTNDLLMSRQLPIVSGFQSTLQNIGGTRNSGIELSLSTLNFKRENGFNWRTDINFSANREKIVQLYDNQTSDIGNKWFVGEPIGVFYDYRFDGIWQNTPESLTEMAKYNANGHNYKPGLIKLADQNGDYKINAADRVILGSPRPKWMGSITNEFSYKDFDFSFQVYSNWGQKVYFDKVLRLEGRWNSVKVDYWTPQNPSNSYPMPSANWETPPDITSTYYQDASFIRVKYITLGYALPKSVVSKLKAANLRVYMSAQNPFLYTKFDGLDPEGGVGYSAPSPKTFMAGINVGF